MANALQIASQFGNGYDIPYLQKQFERLHQMQNANRMFVKIASASDKEQLEDYLAEVRYALVFAGLGFQVEFEPFGGKGPDLRVSRDGHQALVEVTRFRKIYPGPPEFDISDENEESELPDYGDLHRDVRKSFEKLLSKFSQVGDKQSIIAIWNDDGDLEEFEVEIAVIRLSTNATRSILAIPEGLLFVIYGSQWVRVGDYKQLYCFPVFSPEHPHQAVWQHELNSSTVRDLIERAITQGP